MLSRNHRRAVRRFGFLALFGALSCGEPPIEHGDADAGEVSPPGDDAALDDVVRDAPNVSDAGTVDHPYVAGQCVDNSQCPSEYACAYPQGCGATGQCVWLGAPCDAVDVQLEYCTCEGVTLVGRPMDCPGSAVPWSGRGACARDGGTDG